MTQQTTRQHDSRQAQRWHVSTILAHTAAVCLVLSSASFAAVYSWQAASEHALHIGGIPVLAVVAVMMALGLELAKPLAVAAAVSALRNWRPFEATALAMLALGAVAFSLTSELSLLAGLRSDTAAQRQHSIDRQADAAAASKRHAALVADARAELSSLPSARTTVELKATIDGLLMTPGANRCAAIDGKVSKRVCPEVASLRAELGRAERRHELGGIIASPAPSSSDTEGKAVTVADPAATSLAALFTGLGFVITAETIAKWLPLIGILALETGAAFSGLLVAAVSVPRRRSVVELNQIRRTNAQPHEPQAASVGPERAETPALTGLDQTDQGLDQRAADALERAKAAILDGLKSRGELAAPERTLASAAGVSKTTMRRALHGLAAAGVIALAVHSNGKLVRFA